MRGSWQPLTWTPPSLPLVYCCLLSLTVHEQCPQYWLQRGTCPGHCWSQGADHSSCEQRLKCDCWILHVVHKPCQNQLWINYLKQIQYNTCSNKTKLTKAIKLTRMLKFYQKYDFFYPVMNFLIWSKEGIWSGSVPGGWWCVWIQLEVQLDVPTSCSFWTDFIEGWMSGWGWTGVSLRIQCRGRRPMASWLKEHIGRI